MTCAFHPALRPSAVQKPLTITAMAACLIAGWPWAAELILLAFVLAGSLRTMPLNNPGRFP